MDANCLEVRHSASIENRGTPDPRQPDDSRLPAWGSMDYPALSRDVTRITSNFVWDQWSQMGIEIPDERGPRVAEARAVDPEALLLFSFELTPDDAWLEEVLTDWIATNKLLINRQRLRNLCVNPASAESIERALGRSPTGLSARPDPCAPMNLAFRLRSFMGLTARAELVRVLLSEKERPMTVRELSDAVSFSNRNVDRAIRDLIAAGLISRQSELGRSRFVLDAHRWGTLLDLTPSALPMFEPWPQYLRFCGEIVSWFRRDRLGRDQVSSLFLDADDLLRSIRMLRRIMPDLPRTTTPFGPEYLGEFVGTIRHALCRLEFDH